MAGDVSHAHDTDVSLGATPRRVRNRLLVVVVPIVAATLVGLVVLWPSHSAVGQQHKAETVRGMVTAIHGCDPSRGLPPDCVMGTVDLAQSDGGQTVQATLPYGRSTPKVSVGDNVVLSYDPSAPAGQQYVWADFDRLRPMLVLIGVFVLAVIYLSRWEGVGSLFSLGVSLVVLYFFVLPALSHGESPLLVAIVAASFIMIVALYSTHGITSMTSTAVIGTVLALAVTGLLGLGFTEAMHFTGLTDETNRVLISVLPDVQFDGLLLAGLIIGALGVLDDVTVTQSAAVWELAAASPQSTHTGLWSAAMRIGRSHVAATVNTLVLAYAGAALPLLLVFSATNQNGFNVGLTDAVAQEIVRSLVGSLGIIAAVPITTAVATSVAFAITHPGHGHRAHRHR